MLDEFFVGNIVGKLVAKQVEIVCDPTMLLPINEFDFPHERKIKDKYMIVYSYSVPKEHQAYIKRYARKNNLKLVSICLYQSWCDLNINCHPMEFSSYIRFSECVYTTTFHGTIFTLLNHKKCAIYAYKIINDFLSSNTLMFEKNKALYVNLMKKKPLNALAQTQNKRFDMFDVEMAEATADGFEKVTNAEKSSFVDYFKRMWQVNICTQDYKIKLPEEGFQTLKRRILQILDKCRVESLPISEAHANSFLEVIDNLIVEQKQKLQEIQNKEEEDRIKAEEKALAEKQKAEQAKKSEIDDVVEKMLSDGVSADDILAKLK